MFQKSRLLFVLLALALMLATLSAPAFAEEDNDIQMGQTVTVDVSEPGELVLLRFVPEVTATYIFRSYSDTDTYGMLLNSENLLITSNDDTHGSDFEVRAELQAGEAFYWGARFYDWDSVGSFTVSLDAEHSYERTVLTPGTCTEEGLAEYRCSICGDSYTRRTLPAHSWADGKCTACGLALTDQGQCGDDVYWYLTEEGCLILEGSGATWDYCGYDTHVATIWYPDSNEREPAPWHESYQKITSIALSPEITHLGEKLFWSLCEVRELVLPEGLVSLGYEALDYMAGLEDLYVSSTVMNMGKYGGLDWEGIETITFDGDAPVWPGLYGSAIGIDVFYHSSLGGWAEAMESWYMPQETVWYDLDGAIAPEALAFDRTEYTVPMGQSIRLTTNADPYVDWLLQQWTCSPENVVLLSGRTLTGLRPGTTVVTLSSEDGRYSVSCTVTVTESAIPDTGRWDLQGQTRLNASWNDYRTWSSVSNSFLMEGPDGTLERIQSGVEEQLLLTRFDREGNLISEQVLPMELPKFGCAFSGETYNFLLYGQNNREENNDTEVLRIVRYTKDWQRIDHGSVFGANTIAPFDYGAANFAETNGKLFLHTCHVMYTSADGLNHQSNMTFMIDIETMAVTEIGGAYCSHSFQQFARAEDGIIYLADHGDAYPRSVSVKKLKLDGEGSSNFVKSHTVLAIQGETGANATGVSIGGMELSRDHYLLAGNSVDQSSPETYTPSGVRNIFLSVAERDMSGSELIWLTDYTEDDGIRVRTPQLVKIAEDIFLILWGECEAEEYTELGTKLMLLDGKGNALCQAVTIDRPLSDCQPIVTSDGLVTWFAAEKEWAELYRLNWYQLLTDPDTVSEALDHRYIPDITPATCTEGGYTTYTCRCGDTYTADEVEALGHDMGEWTEVNAPTCTWDGWQYRSCSRCGTVENQTIEAPGHSYDAEVTAPTCMYNGYTIYTCSRCGNRYAGDHTEALGHDYGDWTETQAPTCTGKGTEQRCCSRCDATENHRIPPTGHSHTPTVTAPTCTTSGYTTYTCKCGDIYTADRTDPLDHDMGDWTEAEAPTCTGKGTEQRRCSRCEETETRQIPATGHSHTPTVTEPTCTTDGYTTYTCKCGDSYTADQTKALGHDMGDWTESKAPTCTGNGEEVQNCSRCDYSEVRPVEATGHRYQDTQTEPTCTESGFTAHTCELCGHRYTVDETAPLGHDLGAWTVSRPATCTEPGMEVRRCSRCDYQEEQETGYLDHSYTAVRTAPTCTESGFTTYTCKCGDTYTADRTDPLGHDFRKGVCSRCDTPAPEGWEPVENPFTDVDESQWYFQPVLWAVDQEITSGTSATTFSPNNPCTRAQVVTFLWRAQGCPAPASGENPFTDVKPGDYFYEAVLWAVEEGITTGMSPTTFVPNAPCTRAQVVTFLWRSAGEPRPTSDHNPFTDVLPGSYYYDAVLWAVENDITTGTGENTFSPNATCNRAQVVTFLYRMSE